MKPFDYTAPGSLDQATRAGARPATRFIAGGTTLVDLMQLAVEIPEHLIALNPLGGRNRRHAVEGKPTRIRIFFVLRAHGLRHGLGYCTNRPDT